MNVQSSIALTTAFIIATSTPTISQAGMDKSAGDFLVRARAISVTPDESASISVIGGNVSASNQVVPELDFTYFFTDNIAAELILATSKHDASAVGSLLGTVDLGDVGVLPPTLTLQYHFLPKGQFSPYVGAGINYTFFYNENAPGGVVTSVDYENGFGWALQAGADIALQGNWSLNLDVKKIFLNTDVSLNGGAILADLDLDPWVFGIGFGYKF